MPELVVILVVALVVLGPKRLPEVARSIGKLVSEFRRQSSDLMDDLQTHVAIDDEAPTTRPATRTPDDKTASDEPPADTDPV